MELMVEVCNGVYKYDFLLLNPDELTRNFTNPKSSKMRKKRKRLDSYLLHYMIKEFYLSEVYRATFLKTFNQLVNGNCDYLKFVLLPTQKDLIDYNW